MNMCIHLHIFIHHGSHLARDQAVTLTNRSGGGTIMSGSIDMVSTFICAGPGCGNTKNTCIAMHIVRNLIVIARRPSTRQPPVELGAFAGGLRKIALIFTEVDGGCIILDGRHNAPVVSFLLAGVHTCVD